MVYTYKWVPYPGVILVPDKQFLHLTKASELVPDSLFTSPLEFNVIFHDGIILRHELTAASKIRDPVPAKFKHVTKIVTCMLLCCD